MKFSFIRFASVLIGLALLVGAHGAGQAAPAGQAPVSAVLPTGANPQPGTRSTGVRMTAESIVMEVSPADYRPFISTFVTLQNQSQVDEQLNVRFPLDRTPQGNLCNNPQPFQPIANLSVAVNGSIIATEVITTSYTFTPTGAISPTVLTIPCAAYIPLSLQAGQSVVIATSQTGNAYYDANRQETKYVYGLSTGAGWAGTIGSADIRVRMPYDLNDLNVYSCVPAGCNITGSEVRWQLENFEPVTDLSVTLMPPELWINIESARAGVALAPEDGNAWGRLGKAYKDAILIQHGTRRDQAGQRMYDLGYAAYTEAVALAPGEADWHFGFAELMYEKLFWDYYNDPAQMYFALVPALEEVKLALERNPEHEGANRLLRYLAQVDESVPGAPVLVELSGPEPLYLALTPSADLLLTLLPSDTPAPTFTPLPTTPTIAPTPTRTLAPLPIVIAPTRAVVTVTQMGPVLAPSQPAGLSPEVKVVLLGVGLLAALLVMLRLVNTDKKTRN